MSHACGVGKAGKQPWCNAGSSVLTKVLIPEAGRRGTASASVELAQRVVQEGKLGELQKLRTNAMIYSFIAKMNCTKL